MPPSNIPQLREDSCFLAAKHQLTSRRWAHLRALRERERLDGVRCDPRWKPPDFGVIAYGFAEGHTLSQCQLTLQVRDLFFGIRDLLITFGYLAPELFVLLS
jgi:hypothetical protein